MFLQVVRRGPLRLIIRVLFQMTEPGPAFLPMNIADGFYGRALEDWIWRVISRARSRARLAVAPLTLGVRCD